jgi:hypothetical protein
MWNLYRVYKGKKTLMITDSYKKVKARKDTLLAGSRKSQYTYEMEEAQEDQEKFFKEPHGQWTNYDRPKIKRSK